MKLNKIFLAILLLSVFALGTMPLIDSVEAAKWKKYDSGTVKYNAPSNTIKDKALYVSYSQGSKKVRLDIFLVTTQNQKFRALSIYATKTGNQIKSYGVNAQGKKSKADYSKYKGSAKQYTKVIVNSMKKKGL